MYNFPKIAPESLNIYPVVDSYEWIQKLLSVGIKMIQLRIKDSHHPHLEKKIKCSITLAKQYDSKLFINDHWRLAIKYGAYGVHLGQDDLDPTALTELANAQLRLGISTHSASEIDRAMQYNPSYIAIGTVFQSPSKNMDYEPLGIDRFKKLRQLVDIPVVAIGGITLERSFELFEAGADSIAVISDITKAKNLNKRVADWLDIFCRKKK